MSIATYNCGATTGLVTFVFVRPGNWTFEQIQDKRAIFGTERETEIGLEWKGPEHLEVTGRLALFGTPTTHWNQVTISYVEAPLTREELERPPRLPTHSGLSAPR